MDLKTDKPKKCADMKQYQRDYYLKKHKSELLQKIKCELCNKEMYRGNLPRHRLSSKHLSLCLKNDECNKECESKNII